MSMEGMPLQIPQPISSYELLRYPPEFWKAQNIEEFIVEVVNRIALFSPYILRESRVCEWFIKVTPEYPKLIWEDINPEFVITVEVDITGERDLTPPPFRPIGVPFHTVNLLLKGWSSSLTFREYLEVPVNPNSQWQASRYLIASPIASYPVATCTTP